MVSEKGHNPRLTKSCMFGETLYPGGQWTIAEAKLKSSLCIKINRRFPFPLCYYIPRKKTIPFPTWPVSWILDRTISWIKQNRAPWPEICQGCTVRSRDPRWSGALCSSLYHAEMMGGAERGRGERTNGKGEGRRHKMREEGMGYVLPWSS